MSHASDKDPVKRDCEADAGKVARRLDDAAQAVADLYAEETDARIGCCAIVFDCKTEVGRQHAATHKLLDVVERMGFPDVEPASAVTVVDALADDVRKSEVEFVAMWLDDEQVVEFLAVLDNAFQVPVECGEFLLADMGDAMTVRMLLVGDKLQWTAAHLRPMSSGGKA